MFLSAIISSRSSTLFLLAILSFSAYFWTPLAAHADRGGQQNAFFNVNQSISPGRPWTTNLPEVGIDSIAVTLRRESGSNKTFVNLRFGRGQTLENGKREYLRDNNLTTRHWNVAGQRPGNQALILHAYDGQVFVQSVRVTYSQSLSQPLPGNPPHHGNNNPRPPFGGGFQNDNRPDYSQGIPGGHGNEQAVERCRRQYRDGRPRIEIGRVRQSGGVFSGKYRIDGSIFASCVQEAGYYEEGRLRDRIDFPVDDRFNRREFSIQARSGRRGEIRVYTINGEQDYISIDQEIERDSGGINSGGGNNPFGF